MGKGNRLKQERSEEIGIQAKLAAVYDHLYFTTKDPRSANMYLLVLEFEKHLEGRGVKPWFTNFKGNGEQLSDYMDKNRGVLIRLYGRRFPNPDAYLFTGNLKNGMIDLLLKQDAILKKALH